MQEAQRVRIAVLEDEVNVGRVWLYWLQTRADWCLPEERPFTEIAKAVAWINAQVDDAWLLIVDVDLDDGALPDDLKETRQKLEKQDSILASKQGAVLVQWLHEKGLISHALVVTGVAYGALKGWLDDHGVATLLKPVRSRDVAASLLKRWRELRGQSDEQ